MDAKLLLIFVASLISTYSALPYDKALPISEEALVSGIFIPSQILKLFQDEAQTAKEIKEATKEEKDPKDQAAITETPEQISTVLKPEVQQPEAQQGLLISANQQTPVDESKLPKSLNQSRDDNSEPQQENDKEQLNNLLPDVFYIQTGYNGQAIGYIPNNQPQNVYNLYPPNGYYQPQNIVNQQPYMYNPQPNIYSHQPIIYNPQPYVYYQQPVQYIHQPAVYNQPPANSQQPNIYNPQPVFVPQPQANQQAFIPIIKNPKKNIKPNSAGGILNHNQNRANLYALVRINKNENSIPNNNAYFLPVHQVQPNSHL